MTVDWISAGRSRQLRMPGRTFFITALPLFVEVNSQIAFCPSGDDRYSRIISCPCGDARYVVIICFMGSYAKRCLLFFSGTFTCIQYKGKGRGYFLEKKWVRNDQSPSHFSTSRSASHCLFQQSTGSIFSGPPGEQQFLCTLHHEEHFCSFQKINKIVRLA